MSDPKVFLAQERQDRVPCTIIVDGTAEWRQFLTETLELSGAWAALCGGTKVPLLDYLRKVAEVNEVSFERCVLNAFLNRGYVLDEIEVEFEGVTRGKWGKCVWYKEHPSYKIPFTGIFSEANEVQRSFIKSVFKTEHAGDQEFSLYSTQMLSGALIGKNPGILLHKTLIFRRAVLSLPAEKKQTTAA